MYYVSGFHPGGGGAGAVLTPPVKMPGGDCNAANPFICLLNISFVLFFNNTQHFHTHYFTGHTNTRLAFVVRLLDNGYSSKDNSVA